MSTSQNELISWYKRRHPQYVGDNYPSGQSFAYLEQLNESILAPIKREFGEIEITYGFVTPKLLYYLYKHSPKDMAPRIDQHSAMEFGVKGNRICKRDGAACDFVSSQEIPRMDLVARYIIQKLPFDRLYFYGVNKPIHISIGPDNAKYVLLRHSRSDGKRVNGRYAKGVNALRLFNDT